MAPEIQTIPARHGVATFVPVGHTIKIINTSGTQVVDTWAFVLSKPDAKTGEQEGEHNGKPDTQAKRAEELLTESSPRKESKKDNPNLPDHEEAKKRTKAELERADKEAQGRTGSRTWSSYVPSVPHWTSKAKKDDSPSTPQTREGETKPQANSRAWSSYLPTGKGISAYIPKPASETLSAFASSHSRDQSKSYLSQLRDFSRTPVGAAGLAAVTGSGYGGSLYAGYQAWNAHDAANATPIEFLSMTHTRVATLHLRPQAGDALVTNIREPILTLIEDTSGGVHDTLIAACDPARYQGLGVERWEEHGSCAENLVLALNELNKTAGLSGMKAIGAGIAVNTVPAPLNLFMNVIWADNGRLSMDLPQCREGGFVRFRAEKDVVVVMSACPQDVLDINAKKLSDAHFIVEEESVIQKLSKPRRLAQKGAPRASNKQRLQSHDAVSNSKTRSIPRISPPAPARKKPIPPTVESQTPPVQSAKVSPVTRDSKDNPLASTSKTAPKSKSPSVGTIPSTDATKPAPVARRKPRKLVTRTSPSAGQ